MVFPTVTFVLFFIVVWSTYHSLWKFPNFQKGVLLLSGGYFSYCANLLSPFFLLYGISLLWISSTVLKANKSKNGLIGFLVLSLLPLIWFKYSFFIGKETGLSEILPGYLFYAGSFPMGISFVTFSFIAWIVAFWKDEVPEHSALDRLCALTFFPVQASGPVLRPSIVEQFKTNKPINFGEASSYFFLGLFLKLVCASHLGSFAQEILENPNDADGFSLFLAIHAYSFQIYSDFAGYTLMAIGVALSFGIQIPHNFNAPYLSLSITEFWRRWHISLSLFWRDYIYIPLGGNRNGKYRQSFNLMVVMLLCGLWHGAGWNFIIWGGLHGIALVTASYCSKKFTLPKFVSWILCFEFVTFAWIPFRADSVDASMQILNGIFHSWEYSFHSSLFVLIPCFVFVLFEQWKRDSCLLMSKNLWDEYPILFTFLLCQFVAMTLLLSPEGIPNFIYFSF